jgi:flagellar motility protein MotE (MotC chaperone)
MTPDHFTLLKELFTQRMDGLEAAHQDARQESKEDHAEVKQRLSDLQADVKSIDGRLIDLEKVRHGHGAVWSAARVSGVAIVSGATVAGVVVQFVN